MCRLNCWAWKIFCSKVESSETCFDRPNRKLLCVQLHSYIPLVARPLKQNLELRVQDRITHKHGPKGVSLQFWSSIPSQWNVCAPLSDCEEESKQTRAASLPSKWPDLSPHRHSLPGIWRHLTEAHRQISSSISIQSVPSPLLDIKTYGSHYLQIGCNGRQRHREKKGRLGQSITDCVLVIQ